MKRLGAIILSLMMLFIGLAIASVPQPECEETGQLAIGVAILGYAGTTVTEAESLIMDCSNEDLLNNPPIEVPTHEWNWVWTPETTDEESNTVPGHWDPVETEVGVNEIVANEGYTEDLNAVNGAIIYTKSLDLNTANQNAIQNNLEVHKTFDYVANEGGKLTFSEDALMNDMGSAELGEVVLSPLWHGNENQIAFNEFISAGSYIEMQSVSATTNTEIRTIAESADTPVAINYNAHAGATTLNDLPGALGYIEATVTVHSMDSRPLTWAEPIIGPAPTEPDDLEEPAPSVHIADVTATIPLGNEVIYTQKTTASGLFDFRKSMTYLSGVTLTGPTPTEEEGTG